ncbi:hypothetical protein GW17_00032752 [Ensete ventricosum]|nr:hypothetical protein GW17_00032752 [Ensete ventricosum]
MTVCIIPVNAWTCCTSPWKAFGETTNCPVPPPRGKRPGSLNNLQYTVGVYEEVFPSVEDGVGIGLPKLGERAPSCSSKVRQFAYSLARLSHLTPRPQSGDWRCLDSTPLTVKLAPV